jgi:hypothetical protein
MTTQFPAWPRVTGSSLLLFPLRHDAEYWVEAEAVVQKAIAHLGIAVARGLSHCPPYVRVGAQAWSGASGLDALVFACPADIGVFEAAPIVSAGGSSAMLGEVAAFFQSASLAALKLAPSIAWVATHDWSPGDRIRWDSGDVDSLIRFATSPGAWRTSFLDPVSGHVVDSDEWPYWFEVTRMPGER